MQAARILSLKCSKNSLYSSDFAPPQLISPGFLIPSKSYSLSCFDGDDGGPITDVQIGMTLPDWGIWELGRGGDIWHLFESSRRSIMEAKNKQSLNISIGLLYDAKKIDSFKGPVLYFAYWRIAAYYRYLHVDVPLPPLSRDPDAFKSYVPAAWSYYLKAEANALSENMQFAKSIVECVVHWDSFDGIPIAKLPKQQPRGIASCGYLTPDMVPRIGQQRISILNRSIQATYT